MTLLAINVTVTALKTTESGGILEKNIPGINENAPDFKVMTDKGTEIQLSTLLKKDINILLIFYRGHW